MSNKDYKSFELFGLEFPVYQSLIIKCTLITWIILLATLFIAMTFFHYEMTNADLPCGALAGVLVGYLCSIIIRW